MSVGERVQNVGPSGIARFMADHRACDAGVEVSRGDDEGAPLGLPRLACKGCGTVVSYRADDAWDAAAPSAELGVGAARSAGNGALGGSLPAGVNRSPNGSIARRNGFAKLPSELPKLKLGAALAKLPPDLPKLPRGRGKRAPTRGGRPTLRLPAGHGRLSAGTAVLAGIVLLAAVVSRSGDGGTPGIPSVIPIPGAPIAASQDPRYAVNLPEGWVRTQIAGLPGYRSPTGLTLRVYVATGPSTTQNLLLVASGFLASRYPDGVLSPTQAVSQNGYDALKVVTTYDGGKDTALALQAGDTSFLVWLKVEDAAPAAEVVEAKELLASFTPVAPADPPPVSEPPPPDPPAPPADPGPAPDPSPGPSGAASADPPPAG